MEKATSNSQHIYQNFVLDSTRWDHIPERAGDESDMEFTEAPLYYNGKVKNAITSLHAQLPTFALVDDGDRKSVV